MPRLSAIEQQQFDAAALRDVQQLQARVQIMRAALNAIATSSKEMPVVQRALAGIADSDAIHAIYRADTDAMIALESCGGCLRGGDLTPEQRAVYDRLASYNKITAQGGVYFSKNFAALQRALAKRHL